LTCRFQAGVSREFAQDFPGGFSHAIGTRRQIIAVKDKRIVAGAMASVVVALLGRRNRDAHQHLATGARLTIRSSRNRFATAKSWQRKPASFFPALRVSA
jgi:hypothetical protein